MSIGHNHQLTKLFAASQVAALFDAQHRTFTGIGFAFDLPHCSPHSRGIFSTCPMSYRISGKCFLMGAELEIHNHTAIVGVEACKLTSPCFPVSSYSVDEIHFEGFELCMHISVIKSSLLLPISLTRPHGCIFLLTYHRHVSMEPFSFRKSLITSSVDSYLQRAPLFSICAIPERTSIQL